MVYQNCKFNNPRGRALVLGLVGGQEERVKIMCNFDEIYHCTEQGLLLYKGVIIQLSFVIVYDWPVLFIL
mgnify:CR=1 FL=1